MTGYLRLQDTAELHFQLLAARTSKPYNYLFQPILYRNLLQSRGKESFKPSYETPYLKLLMLVHDFHKSQGKVWRCKLGKLLMRLKERIVFDIEEINSPHPLHLK